MRFDPKIFLIFLAVAIGIYIVVALRGGDVMQVVKKGGMNFLFVAPVLCLAFMVASAIVFLLPSGRIEELMGVASGLKGMMLC